ncbi:monocarboxylate transporter 13-like isoform X2 [Haliotis asinina]|uniref:monocarboxylate transporter 13-like isoform X2 n=1 Tax=Haliotis asinina TaxID=109174 RepID=UPI003531E1D9
MSSMVTNKDIDGGWAWVVLAATSLGMVAAGTAAVATGFLQVEFLDTFSQSTGYTSLVTSTFLCLELGMGPFSSVLCNVFSIRVAVMTGGVLMSLGLIIASFSNDLLHLLLAFGALGGAGFGLIYTPLNVILGHYFTHRQPLANGISLASCGTGLAVGAYVAIWLIDGYGWRLTVSALACVSLQFCVIGCLYFPTKHTKATLCCTRRRRIRGQCCKPETRLWFLKDARWWIMCSNYGLLMIGYGIQIVHFPAYAESVHIDHVLLPGLYTTYGVVISIARVLCGVLCNDTTVDLQMVFFSTQVLEGLVIVFMPLYAKDYVGVLAYQILVSLFYGASLVPLTPLVVQLFGVDRLSTVFGWIMLWGGAGSLAGPVIAGWLHDVTLSYSSGFHVGGLFVIAAALLILLIPGCKLATFESQDEDTVETLVHKEQTVKRPSFDL